MSKNNKNIYKKPFIKEKKINFHLLFLPPGDFDNSDNLLAGWCTGTCQTYGWCGGDPTYCCGSQSRYCCC